jgi:hypothetical protein
VVVNAIDGEIAGGMVEQREAGAGNKGAEADGVTLFPSLCFPPFVSLYGFRP